MEIPVLLEPLPNGFRASTHTPVSLSAEGVTEAAALAALSAELYRRLQNGCQLRSLRTPDLAAVRDLGTKITSNPIYPAYLDALADYRSEHNAVPDAD